MKRTELPFDPIGEAHRQWAAHGWEESADAMALVTSIMRVQQILMARSENVLKPFGLTFARYEVLMLLLFSRRGALPLGKIGERLQVGAASVTNAIDRLESAGLVSRRENPSDGRGVLSEITPTGRKLAKRVTHEMNADLFGSLELSQKEMSVVFERLRDLRSRAGDFS